ncbi:hypothetical protein Taro_020068, partial [Colocasia esculenta]|nr:hypothetical protein [Colocasia esculenta]
WHPQEVQTFPRLSAPEARVKLPPGSAQPRRLCQALCSPPGRHPRLSASHGRPTCPPLVVQLFRVPRRPSPSSLVWGYPPVKPSGWRLRCFGGEGSPLLQTVEAVCSEPLAGDKSAGHGSQKGEDVVQEVSTMLGRDAGVELTPAVAWCRELWESSEGRTVAVPTARLPSLNPWKLRS